MQVPILHRFGALQHGLVTRAQLRGDGLTVGQVDHLVAVGRLAAVHAGIYRIAGAPITWDQRLLAACMATRGVASHRAAAALWGVELRAAPPIEVSVAARRAPRPRGVVVHRSLDLTPDQTLLRRGIPVTNPLRLLVDIGAVVDHSQVETTLDSLTSRKIVTVAGARAFRERFGSRGRSGVGALGCVLDHRALGDRRADGLLEPAMARLCRAKGLPQPDFQVWVWVAEQWRRMDFAYMGEMVNVEVDGYEEHGGKYENWADDEERDNELTAIGWDVIRFTWHDVKYRPAYVVRIVRTVLDRRGRELGGA